MENSKIENTSKIKKYRSRYEVDLAVLVISVGLSSKRWMQSKWSINLELFSEKIPSIQRNKKILLATFYTDMFNLLITCA